MKTISKGGFLGINNRRPDFALSIKTTTTQGDYLRAADNVDIDNTGRLRLRRSAEMVEAMIGAHSLHMTSATAGYLVRGSVLYAVTLPAYSETLVKLLTTDDKMSYVDYAGSLFVSNGTDSGRMIGDTWYPMALPNPAVPAVATGIGGDLAAGRYQVVLTHCRMAGSDLLEEGGASPVRYVDLSAAGGLRITIPASPAGATHVAVYVSGTNGSVPKRVATVPSGTPLLDVVLTSALGQGREANQREESPLPAGRLFLFNGMLCSIVGNCIYEGVPYRPGYYIAINEREAEGGRIPFPADVTNAVPCQSGVFVTADKTYWFAGTRMTKSDMVMDVLPYGAVPDTAFVSPDKTVVGWFGAKGIVLGTPQGEVQAVMSDNIDLTPPTSGVSAVFDADGYRRVVSCGWCLNLANMAATTYRDYAFTSISGNYGTLADGIYRLDGNSNLPYLIDFGRDDFGTEALKHLPAVYLGTDSEQPMTLRVQVPGGADYRYEARSGRNELQMQRVDPGKGLRANWYNLSLESDDATPFTLASVSFAPAASSRRI